MNERTERNGGSAKEHDDAKDNKNSNVIHFCSYLSYFPFKFNLPPFAFPLLQSGAQDLRIKMEVEFNATQPPTNSGLPTPTSLVSFKNDSGLPGGLAASIAPADMLNVWNATKLNSKGGTVNTADGKCATLRIGFKYQLNAFFSFHSSTGKKLKCLYCDRLYGYETNLRAHIRQRHQGIRVPCPFCARTFTRNNTVRRHIAREHKHEIGLNQLQAAGQNHAT